MWALWTLVGAIVVTVWYGGPHLGDNLLYVVLGAAVLFLHHSTSGPGGPPSEQAQDDISRGPR